MLSIALCVCMCVACALHRGMTRCGFEPVSGDTFREEEDERPRGDSAAEGAATICCSESVVAVWEVAEADV
jgi:hypothetical protein